MSSISKTKSFLLALVIIIGLIFLNFPSVSGKLKPFFYSISSPVQKNLDRFIKQTKHSVEFLNSLRQVSKQNIELEEKIKELAAQNTQLKELEKENEFLRSYLELPFRQRYLVDLADIVGQDFQGLEKYILANKGSSAGIEKNMPVVVFDNILIGKVIEVFNDFSKILLITSSNTKVPALIQESRAEGLIQGLKENLLLMDLVSKDTEVEKNQTIITSGVGEIFPKGLLIGRISTVESSENEIFQRIEVVPAAEIDKLEKVFIIKEIK